MRGLLFLLGALLLLESTKGTEYEKLGKHERTIVDKAIKQANMDHGKDKHLDFHSIVKKHSNLFIVILKPTSCNSTTQSVHQKDCKTEEKSVPQVSCIDCNGEMKPCLLLRRKAEIKKRMEDCPIQHHAGGAHIMFQTGGTEQHKTGCLGCV
ncbi:cystatin-like protein [Labeo rohita]|uniref:cystatin-like protein n=1 Tax=Labeo rohita TaxID=84645 RepID=UPI0021E2BE3A|nr:cystatin-like protein [Labeo rohita]